MFVKHKISQHRVLLIIKVLTEKEYMVLYMYTDVNVNKYSFIIFKRRR